MTHPFQPRYLVLYLFTHQVVSGTSNPIHGISLLPAEGLREGHHFETSALAKCVTGVGVVASPGAALLIQGEVQKPFR